MKIILLLILLLILFFIIIECLLVESFTEDTNNTKLIMKEHWAGFFSNFIKLIQYLVDNPNTTKIVFNVRSSINKHMPYIEENKELFSLLFENYDEGKNITNTIETTTIHKINYYNEERNKLYPHHQAFKKYIKLKSHLQIKLNNLIKEMRSDCEQVIGIFVRSGDLAKEQPSGKLPTRQEYLDAVKTIDKTKKTKYFLRIDNNEDLNFYKNKLTPYYITKLNRSDSNNNDAPHVKEKFQTLEDLENTYLEIALLSNCEYLIHCYSNMVTASLFMNMEQISIGISK